MGKTMHWASEALRRVCMEGHVYEHREVTTCSHTNIMISKNKFEVIMVYFLILPFLSATCLLSYPSLSRRWAAAD
jgi:hypothetical protein